MKNKKILALGIFLISIFLTFLLVASKISKGAQKTTSNLNKPKITKETKGPWEIKINSKTSTQNLDISAPSALVVNQNTGEALFRKSEHQVFSPASLSKTMTALIALENYKLDDLVSIAKRASEMEPNKIVMKPGEKIKVEDLLYGVFMISANDAAVALEDHFPKENTSFIDKMNEKAETLDLKNSHFTNSSGLDDPNLYSSVYDLAVITRYAFFKFPIVKTFMGTKEYSIQPTDHNEGHWLYHISTMMDIYPGMDGAKTAYTDNAKSGLIATATRGEKHLLIVFLGSTEPKKDVEKLFDFGFSINN